MERFTNDITGREIYIGDTMAFVTKNKLRVEEVVAISKTGLPGYKTQVYSIKTGGLVDAVRYAMRDKFVRV